MPGQYFEDVRLQGTQAQVILVGVQEAQIAIDPNDLFPEQDSRATNQEH